MFGSRPRRTDVVLMITAFLGVTALAGAATPTAWGSQLMDPEESAVAPERGIRVDGGSSSRTSSKSSSLTIARPSGVVVGNVMISAVTPRLSGSGTITGPLGWTLIRRDSNIGGTSLSQALFYKVATAFEPASYTWRFSSSVGATGEITSFAGVDTFAPVVAHGGLYTANARLIAAPSL